MLETDRGLMKRQPVFVAHFIDNLTDRERFCDFAFQTLDLDEVFEQESEDPMGVHKFATLIKRTQAIRIAIRRDTDVTFAEHNSG